MVQHGRTACTLVFVYMSIRLKESVSLGQLREIRHSGHNTTGYKRGDFTDKINLTQIAA